MICSPAKLEANQRNAALSTGPRTPEGKVASRANSFKHGLTGQGIVIPTEDLARISAIAQDIREEYKPQTEIGQAMADRAAMLLVRLDRAGLHELAMVADQVATAVLDFDQFRIDWANDLFEGLGSVPHNLVELKRFPEGIDRLIAECSALALIDDWSPDDLARAARLGDFDLANPETIRFSIADEVRRLEAGKLAIDSRPMERARQQAANLALFTDSPEANLARKYEAITERAFHKAIKTLIEVEGAEETSEIPQTPEPVSRLGSFSPEPPTLPEPRRPSPSVAAPIAPEPPVDRAKRADPKKLRQAQRRNRR